MPRYARNQELEIRNWEVPARLSAEAGVRNQELGINLEAGVLARWEGRASARPGKQTLAPPSA